VEQVTIKYVIGYTFNVSKLFKKFKHVTGYHIANIDWQHIKKDAFCSVTVNIIPFKYSYWFVGPDPQEYH